MPSEAPGPPALVLQHITKSFNGKAVLDNVSMRISPGEIHGLVGANGAGKSTLIKTLSGFHAPDRAAEVSIGGAKVSLPASAPEITALGVRFVHQDFGLVPSLSIAENFTVESNVTGSRLRPWTGREEQSACRERLARFGLPHDPRTLIADLTMAERAMVAVVRAVTRSDGPSTLLVIDEATSGLPHGQTGTVLDLLRRTSAEGVAVLFVSHRLDEVLHLCDTVTVLRDGRVADRLDRDEADEAWSLERLTAGMFGDGAHVTAADSRGAAGSRCRLRVNDIQGTAPGRSSFEVACGEILGITGLANSGASEVGRILFGAQPARAGEVWLDDEPYRPRSPRAAIARSVAYVPASRDLSLLKTLSVTENATLADLGSHGRARLRLGAERRETIGLLKRFKVTPAEPDRVLGTLSGGNQQKIALLKWLRCDPALLVLDEPCRGVDMSARQAIYDLLRNAAADGLSVLAITSEAEDAVELCDRVLVMHDGAVTSELAGQDLNLEVLTQALGVLDDDG